MRVTFQNSNTGFKRTIERPATFNGRFDLNNALRRGLGMPERDRREAWREAQGGRRRG